MRLTKSILSLALFPCVILAVLSFIPAALLVHIGETREGRLFGATTLVQLPVPILLWIAAILRKRRKCLFTAAGLALIAGVLLCVCYLRTPDGESAPGSAARSVFTGTARYTRGSIANLVPEIDQLKLGTYLFPRIDPFIDSAQAVRVRELFLGVYRDMRQSEEFVRLGSVMNDVYRDLFLRSRPSGHLYEYVPPDAAHTEPLPVILFLHGSLGNFKGYLWVWRQFADAHGYAVVAPSFGAGNWYLPGGVETVEHARQYAADHPRMNANRIYLAGLSNGGTGVSRAATRNPEAYVALIFISAVMEKDVLLAPAFVEGWKKKRILLVHGAKDRRIPVPLPRAVAAGLARHDVAVESHEYAEEDHFLFFSAWDRLSKDIAAWVE
ncbi:MAG: hypothetical protein JXR37_08665 [Kiritimatiellae bacterium]|nr:hypothetical protein [Kiritimatiellia bacterium]